MVVSVTGATPASWQVEAQARGRRLGAILVRPAPLSLAETPQFVFTHMPKTGGLTLRAIFAFICNHRRWSYAQIMGGPSPEPGEALDNYCNHPPEQLRGARLVWGHLPFALHDPAAPHIVVLRDPVALALSMYAMGASRGAFPMGTPLADVHGMGLLDNVQTRLLSGLPALLDPAVPCTDDVFQLARKNLCSRYAVAADMDHFDDFLAVMLAALRAPSIIYFHRNMRAVDIPSELANEITAEAIQRNRFDAALYSGMKGRVRVRLPAAAAPTFPSEDECIAFKDEVALEYFISHQGPAPAVAMMESLGVPVRAHTFNLAALQLVR